MAIPLSPCVSVSFYVLFSPSPLCLLYPPLPLFLFLPSTFFFPFRPQPAPLTLPVSFSLPLWLPLALTLSLMGNNIYQSPAEPCSTSCHGNRPHHSIYSLSLPPSFLFFFLPSSPLLLSSISPSLTLCLSLHPLLSISLSFGGGSLNCECAGWPLSEWSSKVNHW